EETRSALENSRMSMELLSSLRGDLREERRLVDWHIREQQADDMRRLEGEIAQLEQTVKANSSACDVVAMARGERASWVVMKRKLDHLRDGMNPVIELSRQNRDVEANSQARALHDEFDDVDNDAKEMLHLVASVP